MEMAGFVGWLDLDHGMTLLGGSWTLEMASNP